MNKKTFIIFIVTGIFLGIMFLLTFFFYKEGVRNITNESVRLQNVPNDEAKKEKMDILELDGISSLIESSGKIISLDSNKKSVSIQRNDQKVIEINIFEIKINRLITNSPEDADPFTVQEIDFSFLKEGDELVFVYERIHENKEPLPVVSVSIFD